MESKRNKKDVVITVVITYFLVWVCAILIWGGAGTFPGAEKTFMAGDLQEQYINIIHMFLRHLFQGQDMMYSFEYGMGMPTWATYAYYTLSPFNLIFAVVADLDLACFLVVVGKIATAGAMFALLLMYSSKPAREICISFSLAYALCGYTMHFYLGIIFLDSMYWMPILLLALKCFVEKGKWHGLCLIYAYMFIVQFYVGYMGGVFSFVVYISYAIAIFGKDVKKWRSSLLHFSLCVLIAMSLSAIITFPAGIELFRLMAADATKFEGLKLSLHEVLGCFYPMEWTNNEGLYNQVPAIFVGVAVWGMCICFYLDRRIAKEKKLLFGIPLLFHFLCMFWEPMYIMIHGFDAPDGYDFRFTGQMAMWMILTASFWVTGQQKEENDPERLNRKNLWRCVCGGMGVLYILLLLYQIKHCSIEKQYLSWKAAGVVMVLLVLYALIGLGETKVRLRCFALVFGAEIVINGWYIQRQMADNIKRDGDYYNIWQEQAEGGLAWIDEQEAVDTSPFYRVRYLNGPGNNISMLYGYNGIGYFSSLEYENTRRALNRLGYATSSRTVKDYGSTMLTRMLFSQKYSIVCGFFGGGQREKYMVERNEAYLPVAFMTSEDILDYQACSTDAFENLNNLASALVGENMEPYPETEGRVQIVLDDMQVEFRDGYVLMKNEDDDTVGKMTITLPRQGEMQEYAYVSRFGLGEYDIKSAYILSEKDTGSFFEDSYVTMPHILPMNVNETGDWEMRIIMNRDGYPELTYETMHFAVEDKVELQKLYDRLSTGGMEITSIEDGRLKGKTTSRDRYQVLFTSIPYDEYWEATIDGESAETRAILDGAFLALVIPEGEHEICLEYINPWVRIGSIISILGLMVMAYTLRKQHRK